MLMNERGICSDDMNVGKFSQLLVKGDSQHEKFLVTVRETKDKGKFEAGINIENPPFSPPLVSPRSLYEVTPHQKVAGPHPHRPPTQQQSPLLPTHPPACYLLLRLHSATPRSSSSQPMPALTSQKVTPSSSTTRLRASSSKNNMSA